MDRAALFAVLAASLALAQLAHAQGSVEGARLNAAGGPNFVFGSTPPSTTAQTDTYSSNVGQALVDNGLSSFSLSATSGFAYLWDVDVHVQLQHPQSGELDLVLVAPDGREVTLSTQNASGVVDAYGDVSFDDSADETVFGHGFGSGQTVTLVPEGALGSLAGLDPTGGAWTLRVRDGAAGNVGNLVQWSLDVTTLSAAPPAYDFSTSESFAFYHPQNNPAISRGWALLLDDAQIGDVRLRLQLTHPDPSHLVVTLMSPSGVSIPLANGQGGSIASAFSNVLFRDDARSGLADLPVSDYVFSAAAAQLVPLGALHRVVGDNLQGMWNLEVRDLTNAPVGFVLASIEFDLWDHAGSSTGFCPSGISSNGCIPTFDGSTVTGIDGLRTGLFFVGINGPKYSPWAQGSTSTLCVKSPLKRVTLPMNSGGSNGQCDGVYVADPVFMSAAIAALPAPSGTILCSQCWYRDPHAPKHTNLTNMVTYPKP
jgi:subtilisin-like proprotein convertase family protein